MHEPEEVRDMNDLRAGILRRHRKPLYDPIDLELPSAKKVCPERGGEDEALEVPLFGSTCPDETGLSAAAAAQLEAEVSGTAAKVLANALGPSSMAAAQSDTTAFGDALAAMETRGSERVSDVSIDEEASDEKSSPAAAVPPSWDELMEMLKGVPWFMDAETPFTRMSDFFPLTKRVSVNMDGDPPTFIKARLPFGTPESVVSCIQHLQEWTIPKTAEVVVTPLLFFSSSLVVATSSHNIIFCFVVALPRL